MPLIEDVTFAKSVSLELGYRYADYTPSGANRSWKAGINWTPIEGLRFRAMQQRAVRVPNVGELAAPLATGLDNAQIDPCSVANVANIDATLRARCIATGQTPAQVGVATNISAGQIGVFTGTDPLNLPKPETGDTTTVGVVWQPTFMTFLKSPSFTVDYYKINIDNYIGTLPAQEILDGCYKQNIQSFCALIKRAPNGGLKTAGFGLLEYNTNLAYQAAEGVDVGANFGLDMTTLGLDQKWGSLAFSFSGNYYLANEFQSTAIGKVTECVGKFGTSCGGPTHEYRWQQRTVWTVGDVQLSYLWRHLSEVDIETAQVAKTFAAFRHIPAYDYIDLGASYNLNDATRITLTATNVFDKDPPIVGSSASTTSANSGNTLPRNYDALGRIFTVGVNLRF